MAQPTVVAETCIDQPPSSAPGYPRVPAGPTVSSAFLNRDGRSSPTTSAPSCRRISLAISTLTGHVLFVLVWLSHEPAESCTFKCTEHPNLRVDRPVAGRGISRGDLPTVWAGTRRGQHLRRRGAQADRQPGLTDVVSSPRSPWHHRSRTQVVLGKDAPNGRPACSGCGTPDDPASRATFDLPSTARVRTAIHLSRGGAETRRQIPRGFETGLMFRTVSSASTSCDNIWD